MGPMDVYIWHEREDSSAERLSNLTGFSHGADESVLEKSSLILSWGEMSRYGNAPNVWSRNRPRAVKRCRNNLVRNFLLSQHGIRAGVFSAPCACEYYIPVFQLQALSVRKQQSRTMFPGIVPDTEARNGRELAPRSWNEMRAARLAVRAVYSLGLDYGLVTVSAASTGKLSVVDVDPFPDLVEREELANCFAQGFLRFLDGAERSLDRSRIRLGADPEFLLQDERGKVHHASRYLDRRGRAGCDSIILGRGRVIYPLAELRPLPARRPLDLVQHIRKTMSEAAKKIGNPQLHWIAGGMPVRGLQLGGHVHVGGISANSRLLRALDNYLALPYMMIEGEESLRRRPKYGTLGDMRTKSHGGFEYRTLPSWLTSPQLALNVFQLLDVICCDYPNLQGTPLDNPKLASSFYEGDKEALKETVAAVWDTLHGLSSFDQYAEDLSHFEWMSRRGSSWKNGQDIRMEWKIIPNKPLSVQNINAHEQEFS